MKIKLKNLVFDDELTSIRKINPVTVSKYRQSYRQGADFPRIIIERETKKIVSGNHRVTAMLAEFGNDYVIDVIAKSYKHRKELLYDFARENAKHGEPLDTYTKKKLVLSAIKQGGKIEDLAKILNTPAAKLENYGNDLIGVTVGSKVEQRPAKHGYRPERPISEADYKQHEKYDKGMSVVQQANQLSRWIEADAVACNDRNLSALKKLHVNIESWLQENS